MPVTFETVRRIGTKLPEVEEATTFGAPALKLRGRLLACIPTNKAAEPGSLLIATDFDRRDALVAEAPDVYYVPAHYAGYPGVLVRMDRIGAAELTDLLKAAWNFAAAQKTRGPKRKSRS